MAPRTPKRSGHPGGAGAPLDSLTAPALSVVVPAYDRSAELRECLAAIVMATAAPEVPASEVIVVDDGSTEDVHAVATAAGARVVRLPANSGPAAARNLGARHARGAILLFVDSDVVVRPDTLARVARTLGERPDVAALFGSYDAAPRATTLVSRYRNLLHHFVHQHGNPEASTFWAGCGAVRRSIFAEAGGFDARRYPRAIEDIELGYRLRQAGHRIALDRDLLVTHLKRVTLASMVVTDVAGRAIPWARLARERRHAPNDLNLGWAHRASAALTATAALTLLAAAAVHPGWLGASGLAVLGVAVLNHDFFRLLRRRLGLACAVACLPLHLLHYACGVLGYAAASLDVRRLPRWRRPFAGEPRRSGIA